MMPFIFLWIIVFILFLSRRKRLLLKQVIEKRKTEGNTEMKELAEIFVGKECVLSMFDESYQYKGMIKQVTNGAVLIEKNGKLEAINLDFVIRIKEK